MKSTEPYIPSNQVFAQLSKQDIHHIRERALYLMTQVLGPMIGEIWIEATCWYLENKKGVKL